MSSIKKIATLAAVALITGCGGGDGGDSSAPQSASMTIQGDAMKGPMAKAKISLYKTTADGKQGELLKETTSDGSGHYNAAVANYSGVVIAVASVVPGTTMYDEATRQNIPPTAAFSMRASFSVEAGKSYTAQINPFTDLATASALGKAGGLNATNVQQANNDLATALTFDPLTTAAVFDVNHKPTDKASAAMMAVSQMALSGSLGCASGDQATKVACVTTALSKKGLTDASVKSELQTTINLVNDNFGLPAMALGNASGTTSPAATPLEQAKTFMGMLRSNAKALDAADLSLQTELQKVADDMQSHTAPLASNSITALNVARLGAQLWNDVIKGNAPFVTGQSFYKDYPNAYGFGYLGGCSFYSDTGYKTLATSKADAKYVACQAATQSIHATNKNGEYAWCSAIGEWCDTAWSYRVRLHPDATDPNKFTVYTQTRESKQTVATVSPPASAPYAGPSYPLSYAANNKEYGAAFPGNAATLVTQRDGNGKITTLSLAGEVSPAFSIEGGSSYYTGNTWVYMPPVATVLGDKHNVALSAALTKVENLEKLALSGSVELIKAGVPESRLELLTGSYLQANQDATGSYSAHDGSQEMLLKLKGGTVASTLTGDLKISAFKPDASGTDYIPTVVAFNGSVQRNGTAFFEGSLTGEALNHAAFKSNQPHSLSNVQTLRVGLTGKVTIPNRPVLSLSLSATQSDKGSSANSTTALSGQYVQGLLTINVSGTSSAAANLVTLESTSGIKLVIDKSKTTYPLTKSGQAVGQYSTQSNGITYTDGTYERF